MNVGCRNFHRLCGAVDFGRRDGICQGEVQSFADLGDRYGRYSLVIALLSNYQRQTALILGILLGIGLGIFFVRRYLETKKPMPSMFMAAVSFIVALGAIVLSIISPHPSS